MLSFSRRKRALEDEEWRETEACFVATMTAGSSAVYTILDIRGEPRHVFWQIGPRWREPVMRVDVAGDGDRQLLRRSGRSRTVRATAVPITCETVRLVAVEFTPDEARLHVATGDGASTFLRAA